MIYYERDGLVLRDTMEQDIEPIRDGIRRKDAEEVLSEGCVSVEDALARSFAASTICLTAQLDGVPVAMFGLVPDALLGTRARVWFLGADGLRKIKKSFVRLSRKVIASFLERYPELYNIVDCRYGETIRWLKSCGAQFQDPIPVGPEDAPFQLFILRRA